MAIVEPYFGSLHRQLSGASRYAVACKDILYNAYVVFDSLLHLPRGGSPLVVADLSCNQSLSCYLVYLITPYN